MTNTFEISTGKKITIKSINQRVSKALLGDYHYAYTIKVSVSNSDEVFSTTFHDSIYHYHQGKSATKEMLKDALYSIILDGDCYDYNRTLDDFQNEFGYEDRTEAKKCFEACRRTFEYLISVLTRDEINELADILNK